MLPTNNENSGIDSHPAAVVLPLGIALLARMFLLVDLPPEAISLDLKGWTEVAAALERNENPYSVLPYLNWPPLWMQVIFGLQELADVLGVRLIYVIRIFLVVIEAGVILILDLLLRTVFPTPRRTWILLFGISLNPISLLLICQHGNFDVLVSFWVLLALWSLSRFSLQRNPIDWLLGCFFLGLGVTTKTIPLLLAPLLFNGYRDLKQRERALGLLLFLGPAAYGLSVLYPLAPLGIQTHVFGYRSFPGWFGFTGLFHLIGLERLTPLYGKVFVGGILLAIAGTALFLSRRYAAPKELLLLATLLLALVPALGPGYGPQYIYWILPLLVLAYGVFPGSLRGAILAFGIIAVMTYVVEYALTRNLGAFLLHAEPSKALQAWSTVLDEKRGVVKLRLPLFFAYLGLLGALFYQLRKELHSEMGSVRAAAARSAKSGSAT